MQFVPLAGILVSFLMRILLNVAVILSPCSAPWMVGEGDSCVAADGLMVAEGLLVAALLGVSGLVGLLGLTLVSSQHRSVLIVGSVVCLVGSFLGLFNAVLFS